LSLDDISDLDEESDKEVLVGKQALEAKRAKGLIPGREQ
jgi:hypothetical protein